jgi:hypothetical protein
MTYENTWHTYENTWHIYENTSHTKTHDIHTKTHDIHTKTHDIHTKTHDIHKKTHDIHTETIIHPIFDNLFCTNIQSRQVFSECVPWYLANRKNTSWFWLILLYWVHLNNFMHIYCRRHIIYNIIKQWFFPPWNGKGYIECFRMSCVFVCMSCVFVT